MEASPKLNEGGDDYEDVIEDQTDRGVVIVDSSESEYSGSESLEDVFYWLLDKGFTNGVLTKDEVEAALARVGADKNDLEDSLSRFKDDGIEIVDEENSAQPVQDRGPANQITISRSMDSLQQYLNDIGKTPLLNKPEEVKLSKSKERGFLAKAIIDQYAETEPIKNDALEALRPALKDNLDLLDFTYSELDQVVDVGKKDHIHLIEANLRLVVSIAKRYRGQGLSFLDLIQEGTVGLIRATEKFDWRRDLKFSTYATWWVRQAVARGIADKSRTVRLPVHTVERLLKINRAEREFITQHYRDPTYEELAELTQLPLNQVVVVKEAARSDVSFDMSIGAEGESELGDVLADESMPELHIIANDNFKKEMLDIGLSKLTPDERKVIELRYGLGEGDPEPQTLDQIAKQLNTNREKIRVMEVNTLFKLELMPEIRRFRNEDYDNLNVNRRKSVSHQKLKNTSTPESGDINLDMDAAALTLAGLRRSANLKYRKEPRVDGRNIFYGLTDNQILDILNALSISNEDRSLLTLKHGLDGYVRHRNKEISELLGSAESTITSKISRLHAKLAVILEPRQEAKKD